MLDCYMALTVPYAIKLAKQLQPYNLKWMEEFLHPVGSVGKEGKKETKGNFDRGPAAIKCSSRWPLWPVVSSRLSHAPRSLSSSGRLRRLRAGEEGAG